MVAYSREMLMVVGAARGTRCDQTKPTFPIPNAARLD